MVVIRPISGGGGCGVCRAPDGVYYLVIPQRSDFGYAWSVSKLGSGSAYAIHCGESREWSCECMAFCTRDFCKHIEAVESLLREEGIEVQEDVPSDWVNGVLRPDLPPLPEKMKGLPISGQGYPIPWFTPWRDGKPDLKIASIHKLIRAFRESRCWVSGVRYQLGQELAFIGGPMLVVNGISSEPPSYLECAQFAVQACPFLSKPQAKRAASYGEGTENPPGEFIARNPGIACVVVSNDWNPTRYGSGILFKVNDIRRVEWWIEGRLATTSEARERLHASVENAVREVGDKDRAGFQEFVKKALKSAEGYLP